LKLVLQAVLKAAPHQWYSIGLELGFSNSEIEAMTHTLPSAQDKLRKVVLLKADQVGHKRTALLLLESCKTIPNPVFEAVIKSLSQPGSQVEVVSDYLASEAGKMVTDYQTREIAKRIAGAWEKFTLYLAPQFFQDHKIIEIRGKYDSPFSQAQAAIIKWRDHCSGTATQYQVIKALCKSELRAQAVEVFQDVLVDFISPL
jgi:hypothetical protein